MIVWGLVAAARGTAGPPPLVPERGNDLRLHAAVAARVAAGDGYYPALRTELVARGHAARSVLNWRLPTLAWLNALPPSPWWARTMLVVVGLAVPILWVLVVLRRAPRIVIPAALVLLAGVGPLLAMKNTVYFHELWAGLLVASSLGCWGIGQRKTSVLVAGAGLAIRELTVLYVVIMAAAAWRDARRKEAAAWAGLVPAFAGFWLWHLSNVLPIAPAEGPETTWLVMGGWGFVLAAAHTSLFLMPLAAQWIAAVCVPVAWAGFWYWQDAVGRRLAVTVTCYFALFMVVGRPDNWYWGFLVAPLIPLGLIGYFHKPQGERAS